MLQNYLSRFSGLGMNPFILIQDRDGIWQKARMEGVAKEQGYGHVIAKTSIDLRYFYERDVVKDQKKVLILYQGDYLPYDIRHAMNIVDASLHGLFPNLNAQTLRRFININLDLLCCAYASVLSPQNSAETEQFCREGVWIDNTQRILCREYDAECRRLLAGPLNYDTWGYIAEMLGFISSASRVGVDFSQWTDLASFINAKFAAWMMTEYRYLSGTPSTEQPMLMSQALDFVRRRGKKLALVVLDGMSFADFQLILRSLADAPWPIKYSGMFSFVPSITSVARQALFSGHMPMEHEKPFSLQNEERQWREYWQGNGYREEEIYFGKTEAPSIPSYTKIAGIVVKIIDDLMHNQLQGGIGMAKDVSTWLQSSSLMSLLGRLREDGFRVFLTADHGNTCAVGQGRFLRPGVITESASRRAAIFQRFDNAQELDKFDVTEYTGTYVPKEYRYYVFVPGTCNGDFGSTYVSHGGMTIEEMVVPFAQIGE